MPDNTTAPQNSTRPTAAWRPPAPLAATARLYQTVTRRYAHWGTRPGPLAPVGNQLRLVRPMTRTWFDAIMPLTVMTVLARGWPEARPAALMIASLVLTHAALTVVNDLMDLDTDAASSEPMRFQRPLVRGVYTRRTAIAEAVLLFLAGSACAFAASLPGGIVLTALALVALQHELPPARTQSRPVISQLAGVIGLVAIIGATGTVPGFDHLAAALPYLLFVAVYMGVAEMLVKDIRDVDNDGATGKNTTATRYGSAAATGYATLAYSAALGAWLWFAFTSPPTAAWAAYAATAVMVCWIGYTLYARAVLHRHFVKGVCVSLHVGSIGVFTTVNVLTLAGQF
ncbi:UbiA family prenyltransferase [Streptomyces sp. TRM70308]|uniref:UbiA prenyltransferase family protein n=1 Tax=Streptomyces sp. TRM70308 TaxID=3131932 RepID=UPI003CFC13B5